MILWAYIISVIIVNMFKHLVVSFNLKELKALQGRKQLQPATSGPWRLQRVSATLLLTVIDRTITRITIYFIHPSRKLKLSFDLIH